MRSHSRDHVEPIWLALLTVIGLGVTFAIARTGRVEAASARSVSSAITPSAAPASLKTLVPVTIVAAANLNAPWPAWPPDPWVSAINVITQRILSKPMSVYTGIVCHAVTPRVFTDMELAWGAALLFTRQRLQDYTAEFFEASVPVTREAPGTYRCDGSISFGDEEHRTSGAWSMRVRRVDTAWHGEIASLSIACPPRAELPDVAGKPQQAAIARRSPEQELREAEQLLYLMWLSHALSNARGDDDGDRDVHVRGYYRADGTYVRPHTRSRPRR